MHRILVLALSAALLAPHAWAQTPPAAPPATQPPAQAAPPANAPVPLPVWFHEIDTAKKGEVTRADFLKYRMKTFEQLDTNKDGKLSVEEFIKVAEPPFTPDGPNLPSVEERRQSARREFGNLDTNRDGFVDRAEAEALVHAEFNQYDTDRDNKVTEAELRLIVQRSLQREAAERQQMDQRRRQGLMTIAEFIDMQLKGADQLDTNKDGKVSRDEFLVNAGPPDSPQTQQQGMPPLEMRRKVLLLKFDAIDTNKDGVLDRVELTAFAVKMFLEMDTNKDRFLNEEEFKKAGEIENQRMRQEFQKLMPAPVNQPGPRPGPAPAPGPRSVQPPPQQQQGPPPGLPQQTR
jgi:Ca2+-binding EF-hand superfamily protein